MIEPEDGDEFRSHWLSLPVMLYLNDRDPAAPPAATPAPRNNGLNSNYHYIGIKTAFRPEQTWCTQRGFTTVCQTRH